MARETSIQTKILTALRAHGGWWAEKSANLYEQSAMPDIYGGYKRYFILFEVKRPNQPYRMPPAQKLTIKQMIEKDAVYFGGEIESVEEALNVLRRIDVERARAGGT